MMKLSGISSANNQTKIIIFAGPTASGKTGLSLPLAETFQGEIVNADSMQVYKLMDIGTAKPMREERARVRHHLIDIVFPDADYNAACYRRDAGKCIAEIQSRHKVPFLVGGTGLYIKALTKGLFQIPKAQEDIRASLLKELEANGLERLYSELARVDPASAARIHANDSTRIMRAMEIFRLTGVPISAYHESHKFLENPYKSLKIGIMPERKELYSRIEMRAHQMIENGLIEEARQLLDAGYSKDLKSMQSIGYRHAVKYLQGGYDIEEMLCQMIKDTRHYAKRQITWFRADPEIKWFAPEQAKEIPSVIREFLELS